MRKIFFLAAIVCFYGCFRQSVPKTSATSFTNAAAKTIEFSGYVWNVKHGTGIGPGPNDWRSSNVWVDSNGFLHLQILHDAFANKWSCAEVYTKKSFAFGKWQFWVEGRIDKLEKNVVLGLFNYSGNDRFDEMDIEWARWGNDSYANCNYTVWPAAAGHKNFCYSREVTLAGNNTTQCFTRTGNSVYFQTLQGLQMPMIT